MTSRTNPHVTPLCEPELHPVEVVSTHVTRRRISPGFWPRTNDVRDLPGHMRITVRTPEGLCMKVKVYLMVQGDFIVASARPNDQVHGEDLNASGAFPQVCELLAEKVALENL